MTTPEPPHPTMLPLSRIRPGDNPRRYFDRQKHEEMVVSMRLRGVLQPPLLRPTPGGDGDTYTLVAGERRFRAALEAFGPDGAIPVFIREMTDQEALEAAIDENDNRDDASETEQADAAARRLAACHGDRAETARRLGWSRAKLDRRLALAELSEPVKTALDERRIKVGHAELLAAVPRDKQDKALETILRAGLDVGKTRDLLAKVTQSLATACFDKAECVACAFNSGVQRVLFETHVEDGYCTNAACFQLKTEAVEQARREEQERAAQAAAADALPSDDGEDDEEDNADLDTMAAQDDPAPATGDAASAGTKGKPASAASTPAGSAAGAAKSAVTAKSIAGRTRELREATWRTALARALAGNAEHARTAILVAAMSGTLSQIKPDTLTARAGLLVDASFPDLDYGGKIAAIRELPDGQGATVLSAIGAAYAKDVASFEHVADLARAFGVDLRDSWQVDKVFLEQFTKEELKFIAREVGLIAHMGDQAFAKRLGGKKAELVGSMLAALGFDWAGRLPSAMALDGTYGPPPAPADVSRQTDAPIAELAA
ncbi:PRTRC system ParB family protein [Sphingomonas sp. H39-1-10]|uniref:PRTRC system ParB family protein n=1 Tax=Sphingomonas pollutisoli TaxID=3030829 RepID=UPI0023B91BFF|nr:PRTRC system ParB family protein [Sphingomonas pollutisoli]MDF0490409.1 PRTRC system ParB family protein [Sphingomonas pollutisoli]